MAQDSLHSAQETLHLVAASLGFLSFFLIWLAVLGGLVLRNGWALTWVRHSTLHGIHTTFALLGLTLGVVHAAAQLAKPGLFRVLDLVVPFTFWRDPIGVGVGVIGLEVMIAVAMSIMFQRALGYSRWRALHSLTYVAFTLLVAHILISGSDAGTTPLATGVLGAWVVTVVVWFITTPLFAALRRRTDDRAAGKQRSQEITVNVNAQVCARFGFCEHEAPDVFRLRGDGRLAYRASVSPLEATPVIRAAEVCPARAITLTRVPTTVLTPQPIGPPDRPVSPAMAAGPRRRSSRYRD
jgi:sulfoxide reductase heme-binding subunit YedZ